MPCALSQVSHNSSFAACLVVVDNTSGYYCCQQDGGPCAVCFVTSDSPFKCCLLLSSSGEQVWRLLMAGQQPCVVCVVTISHSCYQNPCCLHLLSLRAWSHTTRFVGWRWGGGGGGGKETQWRLGCVLHRCSSSWCLLCLCSSCLYLKLLLPNKQRD